MTCQPPKTELQRQKLTSGPSELHVYSAAFIMEASKCLTFLYKPNSLYHRCKKIFSLKD